MKEPKRSDYPVGSAGDKQYKQAMVDYKKWLKENQNTDPQMDIPPIILPGTSRNPSDSEAKNWFKYVAPRSPKGTLARQYYDSVINILKGSGVDSKYWDAVWSDAVDWTQTIGNDSNGDPRKFFNDWNPNKYKPQGSEKQYGTTKSAQTTITQYGPSDAASYINKTIEEQIGRTATQAEIDAYTAQVNAAATSEPSVYTSTTTTAPGKDGVISTSTSLATSKTGFDPAIFAQNFARSRPDFAESFATKNFLNLVQRLLKDPNAIGTVVE